jgi:hypothetical protein
MNNNTLEAIERICIALIAISFFILMGVIATHDAPLTPQDNSQLSK